MSSNLTASASHARRIADELAFAASCGTMPRVTYLELLRTTLRAGLTLDAALDFLRGSGASPAEAAAALEHAIGMPPEQAREAVALSRAWAGPRSGARPPAMAQEGYGGIGQHGRSGHGASSVLPHLVRQAQSQGGAGQARH